MAGYTIHVSVLEDALQVARDARQAAIEALSDPLVPKWLQLQLVAQATRTHRLLAQLMTLYADERPLPEPNTAEGVLGADEQLLLDRLAAGGD